MPLISDRLKRKLTSNNVEEILSLLRIERFSQTSIVSSCGRSHNSVGVKRGMRTHIELPVEGEGANFMKVKETSDCVCKRCKKVIDLSESEISDIREYSLTHVRCYHCGKHNVLDKSAFIEEPKVEVKDWVEETPILKERKERKDQSQKIQFPDRKLLFDHTYFENKDCVMFPCHPSTLKKGEGHNCLFCRCPLYYKTTCPGIDDGSAFYIDEDTKDCSGCDYNHCYSNRMEMSLVHLSKTNDFK